MHCRLAPKDSTMNKKIDKNFRAWLEDLALNWEIPVEQVVFNLGSEEITNRVQNYPKAASTLSTFPFDLQLFANVVRSCWVMGGRFAAIRFNRVIENGDRSTEGCGFFL